MSSYLDEEFNLKKFIHKYIKSQDFTIGSYGIAVGNDKFPYSHLFVTVDISRKSLKEAKQQLEKDINTRFNETKEIEVLEFKGHPKFTWLQKKKNT